jgi:hypothetical protein
MIADSNTLAVGTWYLSALGITSLVSTFIPYILPLPHSHPHHLFNLDLPHRLLDSLFPSPSTLGTMEHNIERVNQISLAMAYKTSSML